LHVFFGEVSQNKIGPLTLWQPDLSTLDWRVLVLAALSGWVLLRQKWGVPITLAMSAILALGLSLIPLS